MLLLLLVRFPVILRAVTRIVGEAYIERTDRIKVGPCQLDWATDGKRSSQSGTSALMPAVPPSLGQLAQ
jgi:hypothetical protein